MLNDQCMGAKELCLQGGDEYFEKLPDELVVFIFTKLSASSITQDNQLLEDLKTLGQCSTVSKRFNNLVSLVPALSITNLDLITLYNYCPIILKKFKHIRSLQLTHWSSTEIKMVCERKPKPSIMWAAHYKPHSYCLAVVSYKNVLYYSDGDRRISDITSKDDEYYESIKSHTRDMICLHHMLVSSIKDHAYLERVVVTDLNYMGRLILEKDTLVELRNCNSTNLELVQARYRSGSLINFDVPLIKNRGFILDNACFCIVEWWEKTMGDHTDKDDDWVIKSELLEGLCMRTLISILENPANVEDNDNRTVLQLLSALECGGSLL